MTTTLLNLLDASLHAHPPESAEALEDRLDVHLSLLDAIRRIDRRLEQRARSGLTPADRLGVEHVHRLYEHWYASAAELLNEVERTEAGGGTVANAAEFRTACRTSHVPGLEPDRLAAAGEQFAQGWGRPLAEVMEAVRRRTVG